MWRLVLKSETTRARIKRGSIQAKFWLIQLRTPSPKRWKIFRLSSSNCSWWRIILVEPALWQELGRVAEVGMEHKTCPWAESDNCLRWEGHTLVNIFTNYTINQLWRWPCPITPSANYFPQTVSSLGSTSRGNPSETDGQKRNPSSITAFKYSNFEFGQEWQLIAKAGRGSRLD